jgi:hypothetical protein
VVGALGVVAKRDPQAVDAEVESRPSALPGGASAPGGLGSRLRRRRGWASASDPGGGSVGDGSARPSDRRRLVGRARRARGGQAPGRADGRPIRGGWRGGPRGLGGVLAGRRPHGRSAGSSVRVPSGVADSTTAWSSGQPGSRASGGIGTSPRGCRTTDDAEVSRRRTGDQGARDRQAAPPPRRGPDRGGHREAGRIADGAAPRCLGGGRRLDGRRVTTGGGAPAGGAQYDWPVLALAPRRPRRRWWRPRRASWDPSRRPASRPCGRRSRPGHVAPCAAPASPEPSSKQPAGRRREDDGDGNTTTVARFGSVA